ncbi:MAG: hypothetical protein R3204_15430, partial [Oceanospirillum sp.]|nr:hypothetical protein [Oceanospirillum sp.]
MQSAMTQMSLSARAFHRILKLARTIADLIAADHIQTAHLAEALQYWSRTKKNRRRNPQESAETTQVVWVNLGVASIQAGL